MGRVYWDMTCFGRHRSTNVIDYGRIECKTKQIQEKGIIIPAPHR